MQNAKFLTSKPYTQPDAGPLRRNLMRHLPLLLALAVTAAAYFYRLDKPLLWGDEADTGIIARNVLRTGYPVAYDRRNVTMYGNGAQLSENLVCKRIPWVQYYAGALSLKLFGDNTAGLRVIFALIGWMAFFPIYAVLKSRVKCPAFTTALALVAPQTVLFQRNARYYSILILLYSLLIWHLTTNFKSAKTRYVWAIAISVLMFHTHPLAAACCFVSLIVYCLLLDRHAAWCYCVGAACGFASWFAWQWMLGPSLEEARLPISLFTTDFGRWLHGFLLGLVAACVDLDVVDSLPLLLWLVLLVVLWRKDRQKFFDFFKQPLLAFVLLNTLLAAVITAAVFNFESGNDVDSLSRYMPHLLLFTLISSLMLVNAVVTRKNRYILVCTFVVGCNLMACSYWTKPLSRRVPFSWVAPVYADIVNPPENIWDAIIPYMVGHAHNSHSNNDVLLISPIWTHDVALFYLGDQYLVPPIFDPPCLVCEKAIQRLLGENAYQHLAAKAEWVVEIYSIAEPVPSGYALVAEFPLYYLRPDDGARPELPRHCFLLSKPIGSAKIYHLQPQ